MSCSVSRNHNYVRKQVTQTKAQSYSSLRLQTLLQVALKLLKLTASHVVIALLQGVFVRVADAHLGIYGQMCVCLCGCVNDFSVKKQQTEVIDGSFESLSAVVGPDRQSEFYDQQFDQE